MTLGRFLSGLGNTNPNYSVLGQPMFVPHGSSGHATFAIPSFSATETPAHEGECFTTSVYDQDCFSVRVSESDCFYVNTGEEEEEHELLTTFTIPGFTEIKALSAHGASELIVIGKYREDEADTPEEVIAKVLYSISASGGIGSVEGVLYVVTLAEISLFLDEADKIDYTDIKRLECWDTTTSLSELAIITTANVYWIEPVLLGISNTNIGHTNASDAIDAPFFKEDTYGKGTYTRTITYPTPSLPPYTIESGGITYYLYGWVECPSGGRYNLNSNSYTTKTSIDSSCFTTNEQSDGSTRNTQIGNSLGDSYAGITYSFYSGTYTNIATPTIFLTGSVAQMRGNVSILGSNKVTPNVSFENEGLQVGNSGNVHRASVTGYEHRCSGVSAPTALTVGDYYVQKWAFTSYSKVTYDALPSLSGASTGVNLCSDNNYTAVNIGGELSFINNDGDISNSITISSQDFTLIKGVALVADGTDEIEQTKLSEVI